MIDRRTRRVIPAAGVATTLAAMLALAACDATHAQHAAQAAMHGVAMPPATAT